MRTLARLGTMVGSVAAISVVVAPASAAPPPPPGHGFVQTNLVSDRTDQGAQIVDANLLNPWGLAFGPTTPLWVADNNAGVATVYGVSPGGRNVTKLDLTVTLRGARKATGDGPSPTGQVFNPTGGFVVHSKKGSGPALFIFSSESGRISAWSPKADPISAGMATGQVEVRSRTAVYKGLPFTAVRSCTPPTSMPARSTYSTATSSRCIWPAGSATRASPRATRRSGSSASPAGCS